MRHLIKCRVTIDPNGKEVIDVEDLNAAMKAAGYDTAELEALLESIAAKRAKEGVTI